MNNDMWMFENSAPAPAARLVYGREDALQFGDLRLPVGPGPHPVALIVHGGFWRAKYDLEHLGHLCADLTGHGLATWSLEFRRIGNPGGGWPGTFQDVAAGADFLRELAPTYNLDLTRVTALGHSAGGHLVLWLAGRSRLPVDSPLYCPDPLALRSVISLAGVTDLRQGWQLNLSNGVVADLLGGDPAQYPDRYAVASPAELLPLGVRQVLIHGTGDQNVPYTLSVDYQQQAIRLGDRVELITLPGAGHFEVINPRSQEWPQVHQAALDGVR